MKQLPNELILIIIKSICDDFIFSSINKVKYNYKKNFLKYMSNNKINSYKDTIDNLRLISKYFKYEFEQYFFTQLCDYFDFDFQTDIYVLNRNLIQVTDDYRVHRFLYKNFEGIIKKEKDDVEREFSILLKETLHFWEILVLNLFIFDNLTFNPYGDSFLHSSFNYLDMSLDVSIFLKEINCFNLFRILKKIELFYLIYKKSIDEYYENYSYFEALLKEEYKDNFFEKKNSWGILKFNTNT